MAVRARNLKGFCLRRGHNMSACPVKDLSGAESLSYLSSRQVGLSCNSFAIALQ